MIRPSSATATTLWPRKKTLPAQATYTLLDHQLPLALVASSLITSRRPAQASHAPAADSSLAGMLLLAGLAVLLSGAAAEQSLRALQPACFDQPLLLGETILESVYSPPGSV